MADELAMQAIGRIERALARIEAASEKAREKPRDDEELTSLREKHQTLRTRVEGAIGEIDRLLASNERA